MTRMNLRTEALRQDLDDATLASGVQAGDTAAFELLMRRYNQRLYRVARSMLRNGADAEEALTLLRARVRPGDVVLVKASRASVGRRVK